MFKLYLNIQFGYKNNILGLSFLFNKKYISKCIKTALFINAKLNVRFVCKKESKDLNYFFCKKKYPTNILIFNYTNFKKKKKIINSDIVICNSIIKYEANINNKLFHEYYSYLLIHGTLHAQGFDHDTKKNERIMKKIELKSLKKLGFNI